MVPKLYDRVLKYNVFCLQCVNAKKDMSSLCEKKSRPVAFAGTGMLEIVDPFPSQEQGTEGTKTNKYVNLGFVHDYYANCCYWAGCFSFEILTGYQLKIKKCRQ